MNDYLKNGLFLAAGVAIGALGAVALGKGKLSIRPAMTDLLSHGMDLKEKTAAVLERAKENMDDLMVEAKHAKESREGKPVVEGETA
ncbi:MAG: hypothetical protein B193_0683 [Solidesulfovibrio magneticus str. Maddingley MBC34]|uniref:Uncharacterized protein n=1 Tax=Solidesulfovibrio magneticus str. Maddingley MBC34 TaxID=1206767 RepID=K6GUK1_9BACT|nr:MAG: hypothetical protein B193_0683 [Solidesulfovibrio magneticus str. Maddingley MBC34]